MSRRRVVISVICAGIMIASAAAILSVASWNAAAEDVWTKEGLALDVGSSQEWDSNEVHSPSVLREADGTYKMWYAGNDGIRGHAGIGYAISTDGITWQKPSLRLISYGGSTDNNMVMTVGLPGSWDDLSVSMPCVLKEGETYKMWFTGNRADTWMIGYAASSDGIHWDEFAGNPIMVPGAYSWESTDIYGPTVVNDGSAYRMWYTGVAGYVDKIGYAYSNDGIVWTKHPDAVIPPSSSGWDAGETFLPFVLKTSTGFEMWYCGISGIDVWDNRMGYAISADGVNWAKKGIVLDHGSPGQDDDGALASPCVLREADGSLKIWYAGYHNYRIRILFASGAEVAQPGFTESYDGYASVDDATYRAVWTSWTPPVGYGQTSSTIVDGALRCEITNSWNTATAIGFDATHEVASDFSLEFDVADFNRGPGGPTLVEMAGIDFRSDGQNCYRLMIQYSQELDSFRDLLWKIPDRHSWPQHPSILASTPWISSSWPQSHHYKIECVGFSTMVWRDHSSVPIMTATDFSLLSGYIGTYFESGNGNDGPINAWTVLDNIHLERLPIQSWVKGGRAVNPGSAYPDWDSLGVAVCCVIHDDDGLYKMWYNAHDGAFANIGYAYSMDGLNWEKPNLGIVEYMGSTDNNIVITHGPSGSWKNLGAMGPYVIKDNGLYRMWYVGDGDHTLAIGYATSTDGIHWSDYPSNPVLSPGSFWWESTDVYGPCVVRDGSTLKMWYTGVEGYIDKIGYATSSDGVTWVKNAEPVLSLGPGWDAGEVFIPRVLKHGGAFEMYYSGISAIDVPDNKIGHAVSLDGLTWTKKGISISNGGPGDLDEREANSGCVILEADGSFRMWYTGKDAAGTNRVLWASLQMPTITALIDIKPGSYPNSINIGDIGAIPVAILGNPGLDVRQIDPSSVNLQGLHVKIVGKSGKYLAHYEDINGDGFTDLVVQIDDTDGVFVEGQMTAVLKAVLKNGQLVEGSDSVRVVPPNNPPS